MTPLTPIIILLKVCSPSAILRAIWSAVVNTIKGVFVFWSSAHICKKVFVRMKPSFTDFNSTASVIWIVSGVRTCAANSHTDPRSVFDRPRAFVQSVSRFSFFVDFIAETAARLRDSVAQRSSVYSGFVSALTLAIPMSIASVREYGQSSELFALQVNFSHEQV